MLRLQGERFSQFGWQTPAAGRAAGRAYKGRADGRQGCNSFSSPVQAKVLHEACLSQASAVTQLETTAQTWTLPGESSGGARGCPLHPHNTQDMPAVSYHSLVAQPRLHRRDLKLTAEWTSCFLKWHITVLFAICLPCNRIQAETKFY